LASSTAVDIKGRTWTRHYDDLPMVGLRPFGMRGLRARRRFGA
jgi:hypothetical protein